MAENLLHPLSWTHIQRIMRVVDPKARAWYFLESARQSWDVRTLDRNISTQYYERLLLSQVKKASVIKEMKTKTGKFQKNKLEFIKNPSVLEFLGLPGNTGYSEAVIEEAIINHLQQFILELGKGFAFVERQQLVRTETTDYYIDLVFYNFILKCFVLIDLKTSRITHQDVGQMDMYVRMYDELKRSEGDNPTIGILLCADTDADIARYSILKGNEHLFATKYKLYLPTEAQLRKEIEREKEIIRLQLEDKE
jgi:predicted nuclease of restriction endonuclease-like (RecB) superfamily